MSTSTEIQRVGIVTGAGASSGLGKAIAERLAREGRAVVVNDLRQEEADGTAKVITEAGGIAHAHAADVADPDAVGAMVDATLGRFGRVDILVNCVGVRSKTLVGDITRDEVDKVLAGNLASVILCINAVSGPMKKQGYGRIVSMGSTAGRRGGGEFMTSTSLYGAAKAGIGGFTRSVVRELGPHGITVNVVAPFLIDVPGRSHGRPPEVVEEMLRNIPMARLGKPEDIAACINFLTSEEAGYVTGVELDVNGGFHVEG